MSHVTVYINKEKCDVTMDGEQFQFAIEKDKAVETITIIARDAAGNETRREMEEVRAIFEHFGSEK